MISSEGSSSAAVMVSLAREFVAKKQHGSLVYMSTSIMLINSVDKMDTILYSRTRKGKRGIAR